MSDDIRSALTAAFEKTESATPAEPASAELAPAASEAPAVEPSAEDGAAAVAEIVSQRSRDEKGRFAQAGEAPPAKRPDAKPTSIAEVAAAKSPVPAPASAVPVVEPTKAPASWKPTAREHWAAMHPEVQQEILRREREIAVGLQESSGPRKFEQAFREVVAPFEGMIRAEGGEPLKAVAGLLQTAAALRTAPPAHKAQLVANIVRSYGISIDMLDAALAGETPQQQPGQAQPQGQLQDPRFDQLIAQMQQAKQRQAQATQAETMKTVEAFTAKAEFIAEVREEMADLIEMAARRGVVLSMDDAYNRATAMHPEVSKVLEQRKAATAANASQASTQRARAAASSVRSQPAGGTSTKQPDDIRGALEAAFAAQR